MNKIISLLLLLLSAGTWLLAEPVLVNKKYKRRILPVFAYTPSTSFMLGAIAMQESVKEEDNGTKYKIFGMASLKKQVMSVVSVETYLRSQTLLEAKAKVMIFPSDFYGVGNDLPESNHEEYTDNKLEIEVKILQKFSHNWQVGGATDFQYTKITDQKSGEDNNDSSPDLLIKQTNGVDGGSLWGFGPAFVYDTRQQKNFPISGWLIKGQALWYPRTVSAYNYNKFNLNVAVYQKIISDNNVLAFNLSLADTGGKNIPWYRLEKIAEMDKLRGPGEDRHKDRKAFFTQLEYRRDLFWRLRAAVFVGAGEVAHNWRQMRADNLVRCTGVGIRFVISPDNKSCIRLDYGLATSGQKGLSVGFNEAF